MLYDNSAKFIRMHDNDRMKTLQIYIGHVEKEEEVEILP
jgi:hypothetical protein